MAPAAFLALLTIAMLLLAALRLELNFRRVSRGTPGAGARNITPELRAAPGGGYAQSPFSTAAFRKADHPRRAGIGR